MSEPIACNPDMSEEEHLHWESLAEEAGLTRRGCMNCGTCHDCIVLTMEASHAAELAARDRELAEVRKTNEAEMRVIGDLQSDLTRLRAELAEACGLLKPFAEYPDEYPPYRSDAFKAAAFLARQEVGR